MDTIVYPQTNRRNVSKVSRSTVAYYSTQVCSSCTKQACKAMELSQGQVQPLYCITLTNKLVRTLPPPDSPDMDQAYQCSCDAISTAAKKCMPRGRRNNRIPCRDAECGNLYQTFLQYPERHESSRAATALLARLHRKRRNRRSEAVQNIDFSHSRRVAWST